MRAIAESKILRSVSRFGEATLDSHGECRDTLYNRQEEIYFVLAGSGTLRSGDRTYPLRANDFTYLTSFHKTSLSNNADTALRVLVMGFNIPPSVSIGAPPSETKIVTWTK